MRCRSTRRASCTARCRSPGPAGVEPPDGCALDCRNEVPHGGDGLSATAIVTGIIAAQALHDLSRGKRARHRPRVREQPRVAPRGPPGQRVGQRPRRGDPVVDRRQCGHHHRAPARAPRCRAGRLRARRSAVDGQGPLGAATAGSPGRRRRQLGTGRPAHPRPRLRAGAPARGHPRLAAPGGPAQLLRRVDGAGRPAARRGPRRRRLRRRALGARARPPRPGRRGPRARR